MFAICVTFRIAAGQMEAFMPLMLENAAASKKLEPGCHRFDVLTDADKPDQVFLYELYTDSAAFDAHCDSAHFKEFSAATADMVAGKEVTSWSTVAS
ncbi:putative quinol monooxygenase [Salipiger sp. 1_MG-2023]|uniref:putative quinol monooxygenase n=1 Tax=Salipiger sp. 1_MG-2023 TaxID=3062665 RepID=UPI0026E43EE4|nr:putative quinol monooxygenase [Salipiger sp. 1_MG-2023]MDO6587505.1 putative quinol monooxygenase [Salipiger sp. 1_MG-2023]